MAILVAASKIGVYVIMTVSLFAAFAAVSLPNLFHSALALVVTLVTIAGLFFAVGADFLAAVQILLYVGAVMTLVIFAVMLTQRLSTPPGGQSNKLAGWAGLGAAAFAGFLVVRIFKADWHIQNFAPKVTVLDLGKALMGPYVFPFEVISVILIAALVGAVLMAKKDTEV